MNRIETLSLSCPIIQNIYAMETNYLIRRILFTAIHNSLTLSRNDFRI